MSTLTKILIILLTISSIFLCGIVVTYVAYVDNYRKLYEDLRQKYQAADQNMKAAERDKAEALAKSQQNESRLTTQLNSLKAQVSQLQTDLNTANRDKAQLQQRVDSWTSQVQDFRATNANLQQMLNSTLDELNKVKAEQIKDRKELEDLTTTLEEKLAIIAMLDQKTKRLLEEKAELQGKLDKYLQPVGRTPTVPVPVTRIKDKAKPVPPVVRKVELKGLVTAVDLKNKMASISLGLADGVKEGMKFHVTRDDKFLCNIVILDVDAEQAVGFLDLVQVQPKTGDQVATSL